MLVRRLVFRVHALERMSQRGIAPEDVKCVLENDDVIEEYADDSPYPSRLVLGWHEDRPLHIVVADDPESDETIVITVYEPESDKWHSDLRRRKP